MNSLIELLTPQGEFSIKKYMCNLGCVPSTHTVYLENEIDIRKIDDYTLNELLTFDFSYRNSYKTLMKTSEAQNNFDNEDDYDSGVFFVEKDLSIYIETKKIAVFYSRKYDSIYIRELIDKILKIIPYSEEKKKIAKVQLVTYNNYYDTIESAIKSTTIDIKKNYNDDFFPVYDKLVDFIHQRESGIALLSGTCGTGKTTLVRNLITHESADYLFITPSVAASMGNPDFVGFLMDNKNSIFIMEDCEQLLQERVTNSWSTSLANILNMTDGILSDIFNIKFICTFNASETTIDPALLREGRCFVNYKFDKLKADKVAVLNKENNLGIPEDEICDMTLAELYNYQGKKETKKKIGF